MTFIQQWAQVKDLTMAWIKSRYRKTWAGFLWVIMNPILQFGVQSLVFKKFLRLEISDYYLFLLGGLLPWIFLTSTISMGTPVFVQQSHLLRSFKINPMVILSAQILDNFINFIASLTLVMLPFYLLSDRSMGHLLLLPLAIVPILMGALGLTVILSVLNVFYRDINFVIGFIFSLLFFLTPVFYPREYIPQEWQWMVDYNPIYFFIEPFRMLLHQSDLNVFFISTGKSFLMGMALIILSLIVWKRKRNVFYFKL